MKKTLLGAVALMIVVAIFVLAVGWLQKKGEEKKPVQPKKEESQSQQKLPPSLDTGIALSFDGSQQAPEAPQEQCGRVRLVIKL